jgi:Fe-S-cluster containining protein
MSQSRYLALRDKVDAFHQKVTAQYSSAFACGPGCSMCCERHLSVFTFEFQVLAQAIAEWPLEQRQALREHLNRPENDRRCILLDDQGLCTIYASRPIICRSHGLPIKVPDTESRDVCPKNFTEATNLDAVHDDYVLDLGHINTLMALIDHVEGDGKGTRISLREALSALLQPTGQS